MGFPPPDNGSCADNDISTSCMALVLPPWHPGASRTCRTPRGSRSCASNGTRRARPRSRWRAALTPPAGRSFLLDTSSRQATFSLFERFQGHLEAVLEPQPGVLTVELARQRDGSASAADWAACVAVHVLVLNHDRNAIFGVDEFRFTDSGSWSFKPKSDNSILMSRSALA